ncbi:MAG: hydroxymethylglutaryl-CoA lyase [Pseudomonadota bacterium]
MPQSVEIVEVSPRDGIQNEKTILSTDQKVELIGRSIRAGVRRIEATSFVNPKRVPQMADAVEVMAGVREAHADAGVRFIGLALNKRGYDRAVAAEVDEVNCVVVTSETFNQKNQGAPVEETLRQLGEIAEDARGDGMAFGITIAASFGCPFEGEVPVERLVEVSARCAELKPMELALADTIGVAAPTDIEDRIAAVKQVIGDIPIRCHFHNTRNTGLANAVAAVRSGAVTLDSSIGGVGGCPFAPAATGNIPTEDLAYMLHRMGIETGLDLDGLIETADWLGAALGHGIPAMLGKAGVFPPPEAAA